MNAFLNPINGTSLTNIIDVTAHSITFSDSKDIPTHIHNIFIPETYIAIPEPIDVQTNELGGSIISMYQFVGDINGEQVCIREFIKIL